MEKGKTRVAILIGVSSYDNMSDLPATTNDVLGMRDLLEATGRFAEILTLSDRCIAADLRKNVPAWLEKQRKKDIDQAFFYFAGHGAAAENHSLYFTSDYEESQLHNTSLSGSIVDDWLRVLAPRLAVKVIDSCNSGHRHIRAAIGPPAQKLPEFRDVIFFSSSSEEQSSREDGHMGDFTRALMRVISTKKDGSLPYMEILIGLRDEFEDRDQSPRLTSSDIETHEFCVMNREVRSVAKKYTELGREETGEAETGPSSDSASSQSSQTDTPYDVVEGLRQEAETYFTQTEAAGILQVFRNVIDDSELLPKLAEVYILEKAFSGGDTIDYSDPPYDDELAAEDEVGRLLKRPEYSGYFARPDETEPQRLQPSAAILMDPYAKREIPARVVGFVTTASVDFDRVRIRAVAQIPSAQSYELGLFFLWSKKVLTIMAYTCKLEEPDWDRLEHPESVRLKRWRINKAQRTMARNLVGSLLDDFNSFLAKSTGLSEEGGNSES